MDGSHDLRPRHRGLAGALVRLGVALGAATLALGVAPTMASAQPTRPAYGTAGAAQGAKVAAAAHATVRHTSPLTGTQVSPADALGVVYQLACDYGGCSAWFTLGWPYNRARVYVTCTGGWALSDTFYGEGGGFLRADCARWGVGSPTWVWFWYWTA